MPNKPPTNPATRAPRQEPPDDYAPAQTRRRGAAQRMGLGEAVIKSFIRSIASSIGRIIVRTLTKRMR